jgi:SHS2 domain-containing protein
VNQDRPAYSLIEHEADLGFEVAAPDLERLFARAALALHDIVADTSAARPEAERRLDVEGADLEDLLVRFLEEAHYAFEGEGMIFARVDVERVAGSPGGVWTARGAGRGERFDRERHELRRPVKAVTYHALRVEKRGDEWRAGVILDL